MWNLCVHKAHWLQSETSPIEAAKKIHIAPLIDLIHKKTEMELYLSLEGLCFSQLFTQHGG